MMKKWGGNRRKSFYGEMWGNIVSVEDSRDSENPVRLFMCGGLIETVKYISVKI